MGKVFNTIATAALGYLAAGAVNKAKIKNSSLADHITSYIAQHKNADLRTIVYDLRVLADEYEKLIPENEKDL